MNGGMGVEMVEVSVLVPAEFGVFGGDSREMFQKFVDVAVAEILIEILCQ